MKQGVVTFLLVLCAVQLTKAYFDQSELSPEQLKQWHDIKEACITESGVSREFVEEAEKGVLIIDEKLACFGACAMKKIGLMREDGSIDIDAGIANIPIAFNKERAEEALRKCAKLDNSNLCMKAGIIIKCLMDQKKYVLTGKM